jgi:hypothetical protein
MMFWDDIQLINTGGLQPGLAGEAEVLNRRIQALHVYRQQVERNMVPVMPGRPGTAYDEAVRRELVLRTDLGRFNARSGRDDTFNAARLTAVKEILAERGTHTSSGAV